MNSILELYKKHINSNPDGAEIHNLFSNFDLSTPFVHHPNCPPWEKIYQEEVRHRETKINLCKEWIIKNSKIL